MKVLLLNGSTKIKGTTYLALEEIAKTLNKEGIETEIFELGPKAVRDCIGCNNCVNKGHCIFNDDKVNEFIEKAETADGFVFGSPVYYAHPSGSILSFLDRVFYARGEIFAHKAGATIVTARRAGTTASLDALNKYLSDSSMYLVGSSYWNMVFGPTKDKAVLDEEGLQTMKNLGKNMAYVLKCFELGKKEGINPPVLEKDKWTNFNK